MRRGRSASRSASRSRVRSRSRRRLGNPNPAGVAAEGAVDVALREAATQIGGIVVKRGDPREKNPRKTYVDFHFYKTGDATHYRTIQHKGCEFYKHTESRHTTYRAGRGAKTFDKIKAHFLLFTLTVEAEGPLPVDASLPLISTEFYLLRPTAPILRGRQSVQWTLQEFRGSFADYKYESARDIVAHLKTFL